MIYCVVPQDLADELYDKLVDYYNDDPNVKVIVDRRYDRSRRGKGPTPEGAEVRRIHERRQRRVRNDLHFPGSE